MNTKGTCEIRSIKITPPPPAYQKKFLENKGNPPKMNNHYLSFIQHSCRNVANINLNKISNYK